MSITEAVVAHLKALSDSKQQEVLDFAALLERREREAARFAAAQAEAQESLNGPARSAAESRAEFRRKFNPVDRSHLSDEKRQNLLDAEIAALPPDKRAEAIRLGFL